MRWKKILPFLLLVGLLACQPGAVSNSELNELDNEHSLFLQERVKKPSVVVLGIAQDAGYPQAGCLKSCCELPNANSELQNYPVSLALIDPDSNRWWLVEATPEIGPQMALLHQEFPDLPILPEGIFLSHAHIGHYAGLIQLGREAMGTRKMPVYAMPRMAEFLKRNGPWSQLVKLENIVLLPMQADSAIQLPGGIEVIPFQVPHRDEFSETVGFFFNGPEKENLMFIPDIDKWQKWDRDLEMELKKVKVALLDGTFFENGELPGRDMSEIPHPFVEETMDLLQDLSPEMKARVFFIHFNHTNPLNFSDGKAKVRVKARGFGKAERLDVFSL